MGKASRKKRITLTSPEEGLIEVKFTFAGQRYIKKHQLTASEIKHMKDLCVEVGDEAADQMIWKVAMRGIGLVAENIMAQAGKDYVTKYYKSDKAILDELSSLPDVNKAAEEFVERVSKEGM